MARVVCADAAVEASYFAGRDAPSEPAIDFWLRELRTPDLLIKVAQTYPSRSRLLLAERPLLSFAAAADPHGLTAALAEEERAERARDRLYWEPLRRELETLRRWEHRQRV